MTNIHNFYMKKSQVYSTFQHWRNIRKYCAHISEAIDSGLINDEDIHNTVSILDNGNLLDIREEWYRIRKIYYERKYQC